MRMGLFLSMPVIGLALVTGLKGLHDMPNTKENCSLRCSVMCFCAALLIAVAMNIATLMGCMEVPSWIQFLNVLKDTIGELISGYQSNAGKQFEKLKLKYILKVIDITAKFVANASDKILFCFIIPFALLSTQIATIAALPSGWYALGCASIYTFVVCTVMELSNVYRDQHSKMNHDRYKLIECRSNPTLMLR